MVDCKLANTLVGKIVKVTCNLIQGIARREKSYHSLINNKLVNIRLTYTDVTTEAGQANHFLN